MENFYVNSPRPLEAQFFIALAIAVVACVTDLRTGRIPNLLTFGGAVAALFFHAVVGRGDGLADAGLGWLAGVVIFGLPFALGGLGGGDVKLLAAIGAWIGPESVVWAGACIYIVGGVLAIGVAMFHGYLRQAMSNVWLLLMHWRVAGVRPLHEVSLDGNRGPRFAYAVPILFGLLVSGWLR
jgi:prepilin peptidase CpaA